MQKSRSAPAVPPVERMQTPCFRNPVARSWSPALSDTEMSANRFFCSVIQKFLSRKCSLTPCQRTLRPYCTFPFLLSTDASSADRFYLQHAKSPFRDLFYSVSLPPLNHLLGKPIRRLAGEEGRKSLLPKTAVLPLGKGEFLPC